MRQVFFALFLMAASIAHSTEIYIKPKAYLDIISGKMVSGKIIGIKDGLISFIGDKAPNGAKIRNFSSSFIMPGLIDCHTHVFFTQTIGDVDFEKSLLREIKISDEVRTKRARNFLKQYLDHGFTSVCDLGNSGNFLDASLKKIILKDPSYPDLYVSGPGLVTEKGQFYPNTPDELVKKEYLIVNESTNFENVLQDYLNHNVDILKIYLDNSPGKGGMPVELVSKILNSPLAKKFKKITFHAIEKESVDRLLGYKNISIEHGTSTDWALATRDKTIYLTMTDLPIDVLKEFNYYNTIFYNGQIIRAKEAYRKKIMLVFGTDFYFHKDTPAFNRGAYAIKSIDAWTAAEIAPVDILRAMTINASKSLHEENIGVIRIGAKANLIGMAEDPTEDINALKNLNLIVNKGQVVKMDGQHRLQKKK